MNPLEEATVDDLFAELKRRYPLVILAYRAEGRTRAGEGMAEMMYGGTSEELVGVARIVSRLLERDVMRAYEPRGK